MKPLHYRAVTRTLLRRMPLPPLAGDDDKETRGRVLVVGGSMQVPGAILLAGVAALRAGAGKLQLATVRGASVNLGLAVPESLVVPLAQTRAGEIAGARAAVPLRAHAEKADAVLIGPGMSVAPSVRALIATLIPHLGKNTTLVLDGAAVVALRRDESLVSRVSGRVLLTPHAGEMAALLGMAKREVEKNAPMVARQAAAKFGATVVLKGAESWIAEPEGGLFRFTGGSVGLGTSGSGDTLAGIIAGLAASGASASTAAVWGVWAHGAAGRLLAKRFGMVGFLARELLAEVPALVGRR
jgi:ADP-dependent NAD(P)H-hydrate dehydratase